ncbi:MAG: hypothetical protein S4CHLAM20_05030 [Chlamydiia bacterium]|nr:hypothetical protein [Chlamydiia bacterium]
MIYLKELLFPKLCHRCHSVCSSFLCEYCMLGIELGERKRNTIYLFNSKADFLSSPQRQYEKIIESFVLIQLIKHEVSYEKIVYEPELVFLKKFILKNYIMPGKKTLYLAHREINPYFKKRPRLIDWVLLV